MADPHVTPADTARADAEEIEEKLRPILLSALRQLLVRGPEEIPVRVDTRLGSFVVTVCRTVTTEGNTMAGATIP